MNAHSPERPATEVYRAAMLLFGQVSDLMAHREDFPPRWIAAFAYVAAHPNCLQRELQDALKLDQRILSSIMRSLSASDVKGLGILDTYQDLQDRRARRVRLTPKGERVAAGIARQFEVATRRH